MAVVDGCYQKEVCFDYDRYQLHLDENSSKDWDTVLALGHAVTPDMLDRPVGSWQMGNLMLFRGMYLLGRPVYHHILPVVASATQFCTWPSFIQFCSY